MTNIDIYVNGLKCSPASVAVGIESDHRVTKLTFHNVPVGDSSYIKFAFSTPAKVELTLENGALSIFLTRTILAQPGSIKAQLQVETYIGNETIVWQSEQFTIKAKSSIDADGALEESAQPAILTVAGLVGQAEAARDAAHGYMERAEVAAEGAFLERE